MRAVKCRWSMKSSVSFQGFSFQHRVNSAAAMLKLSSKPSADITPRPPCRQKFLRGGGQPPEPKDASQKSCHTNNGSTEPKVATTATSQNLQQLPLPPTKINQKKTLKSLSLPIDAVDAANVLGPDIPLHRSNLKAGLCPQR